MNLLTIIRHPVGGIRSYLRYNYARLDPTVYRVTIVTVPCAESGLLPRGLSPVPATLELVAGDRPFVQLLHRTRRLLREEQVDLVHSQGLTAAVIGVFSTLPFRTPHVLTLHETFQAEQFSGPLGPAKKRFLKWVLERLDRVIVVGDDAADNLAGFFSLSAPARSRVVVIPNGVATDQLLEEAKIEDGVRSALSIGAGPLLLGFVGRFMPEKGFDLLIDAVDRLARDREAVPAVKVLAVNDGAYIREYRDEIARRGLGDYFVFAGFRESIASLLRELDALVIPSRREAAPLVAMEAMVLGCPLVASDCVGLREVTRGTPAVGFKTNDVDSLAEALRTFMEAAAETRRRAAAYASTARARFDSGPAAKRLESVIRQACGTHAQPTITIGRN